MNIFKSQTPVDSEAQQEVARLLNSLSAPEKSASEWLCLENRIMADVAHENLRRQPAQPPLFAWKPVLASAFVFCAIIACLFLVRQRFTSAPLSAAGARLIYVEGTVECANIDAAANPGAWHKVRALEPFAAGSAFRVSESGRLRALLDPKSVIDLSPGSRLTVIRMDNQNVLLRLDSGAILLSVNKRSSDQNFAVVTQNARCEVVGTRFKVQAGGNGTPHTTLSVIEGAVSFRESQGRAASLVRAGESAVLSGNRLSLNSPIADPPALGREFNAMLAAVPEAGPTGLLSVFSEPPGADVLIDGVSAGHTPLSLERAAGNYSLTLCQDGFAEARRLVSVAPHKPQLARATLEKIKYLAFLKRLIEKEADISVAPVALRAPVAHGSVPVSFDSLRLAAAEEAMQSNAFTKALGLFTGLSTAPGLPPEVRVRVLDNIAKCHRGKGDYRAYAGALESLFSAVRNPVKRDNLLWELVGINATYLGRYDAARAHLLTYLTEFKNGIWIQEAYLELAEVEYLLGKPADAARAYREYIRRFPGSQAFDKAVYNLAYLYSHDLSDCNEACQWYRRLETEFPSSSYIEDALFWKADCFDKMSQNAKARDAYSEYLRRFPSGRWKSAASERLSQMTVVPAPQKG